jgi:hypothetical protein
MTTRRRGQGIPIALTQQLASGPVGSARVGPGSVQEVRVNGEPAALIRGVWADNSKTWGTYTIRPCVGSTTESTTRLAFPSISRPTTGSGCLSLSNSGRKGIAEGSYTATCSFWILRPWLGNFPIVPFDWFSDNKSEGNITLADLESAWTNPTRLRG